MPAFKKILVIQTAFIGDVILATAVAEKLHRAYPKAQLHFLVRKGNESLFAGHPFIGKVWVRDKSKNKIKETLRLISALRSEHYCLCVNLHRFFYSGLLTALSGARMKVGFDKNPLSFAYHRRRPHVLQAGTHEVNRNQSLIAEWTDAEPAKPALYTTGNTEAKAQSLTQGLAYVCMAPHSVWFTKQWPAHKWAELIDLISERYAVYLLGAPADAAGNEAIMGNINRKNVHNMAGKLSLPESFALIKHATLTIANDSAPLHLASAANSPVVAVFCSTVADFGFGPLSDFSHIAQTKLSLKCRPCGLHGKKACPLGHFECAESIDPAEIAAMLPAIE